MVNQHRHEDESERVTRSAVYRCIERMPKRVTTIRKRPQGSKDPESAWAKWRHKWTTQLLMRAGKTCSVQAWTDKDGNVPDFFKQNLLSNKKIDEYAITWWDEVHKNCTVGDMTSTNTVQLQVRNITLHIVAIQNVFFVETRHDRTKYSHICARSRWT